MGRLLITLSTANAACECGYSVNKTTDQNYQLFTEMQENDFLHTDTDNLTSVGWHPQGYNISAKAARGPYGKSMQLDNLVTNPFKNSSAWSGDSQHGGDAGLQLWVRSGHTDNYISGAEMASDSSDALLGSFRIGMKMSNVSGTCGAFFFVLHPSALALI